MTKFHAPADSPSRFPEFCGAVFATSVSVSIENHGLNGFLHDSWFFGIYSVIIIASFAIALYIKRNFPHRWAEYVRVVFFFTAVLFVSILIPTDLSRFATLVFALIHVLTPTILPSMGRSH